MSQKFSVFEVILLVGIMQGSIMSILLFLQKPSHINKKLLAYILLIFNVLCIKILLHTTHLWDNPYIRYVPISVELLIPPIIYFYALSITNSFFKFEKKTLWHFVPYVTFTMYSVAVYLKVLSIITIEVKDILANLFYFNEVKSIEDVLSVISSIIYWVLSYRLIIHYHKKTYLQTSNSDMPTLHWLRNIMVLSGILIILLGYSIWQNQFVLWQIFHVFLAILIYYMGLRGYSINPLGIPKEANKELDKQQKKSRLEIPTAERLIAQNAILNALDKDKCYLDVELTIDSLSQSINLSPNLVSSIINNELNTNFRTLINHYRILHIKERLLTNDFEKLSIAGLSYECGFNSEASFYRVFKSIVGMSPKEFIQVYQK